MRLIDADVLKEIIEYQQTINVKLSVYDVIKLVDNAPTVITEDFMNPYEEGYERGKKDIERLTGELISREALKEEFREICQHNCYYCKLSKWDEKGDCYICGLIDNAPTITPEKALMNKLKGEEK